MMPIIVISLFFVIFIESTKSYDPCTSKIYKLYYGSNANLLVEAEISVIEHEDIFNNHLNITLIGHNVMEREMRKISLKFQKRNQYCKYYCSKLKTGSTEAAIRQNHYLQTSGSSIYMNNKLICWWIISTRRSLINDKTMDLINECDYKIYLISDETSALVAHNSEDVPICGRKYTKCAGNINYGNNNYSLVIKPNDYSIAFYLQLRINDPPEVTEVKLNSSDGTIIRIICNHTQYNVFGYISDNFDSSSIPLSQLIDWKKISKTECGWKLPRSITFSSKFYEIDKIEGELSIIADGSIVYRVNHIKLTNFATKKSSNLMIIILTIAIILILIILLSFLLCINLSFNILNSILIRVRCQSNISLYSPQFLELRQVHASSAQFTRNPVAISG